MLTLQYVIGPKRAAAAAAAAPNGTAADSLPAAAAADSANGSGTAVSSTANTAAPPSNAAQADAAGGCALPKAIAVAAAPPGKEVQQPEDAAWAAGGAADVQRSSETAVEQAHVTKRAGAAQATAEQPATLAAAGPKASPSRAAADAAAASDARWLDGQAGGGRGADSQNGAAAAAASAGEAMWQGYGGVPRIVELPVQASLPASFNFLSKQLQGDLRCVHEKTLNPKPSALRSASVTRQHPLSGGRPPGWLPLGVSSEHFECWEDPQSVAKHRVQRTQTELCRVMYSSACLGFMV